MRRRADVIRPDQNRNSNARLPSDQLHHGSPRRERLLLHLAGRHRATLRHRRPAPARPARGAPARPGCMLPQASSWARCMRQRSSGCVATGSSDASWPQYSNSRRGAYQAALSTSSSGIRPEPAEQRQVVAAGEHVDRVDLQQADLLQHAPQGVAAGPRRAAVGEALRGQRDPARLGSRQPLPARLDRAIDWFLARQPHDPQPDGPARRAVADLVGGRQHQPVATRLQAAGAQRDAVARPARRDRLIVRARDQTVQRRPRLARTPQGFPLGRRPPRARLTASVTVAASDRRKRTAVERGGSARAASARRWAGVRRARTPSTRVSARRPVSDRPAAVYVERAPRPPPARRAGR